MKSTFVLPILLCALSFGLGDCGNVPERVDMIAEGDTSFTVFCAAAPAASGQLTSAMHRVTPIMTSWSSSRGMS
jgi:hypothetical protein